MNVPPEFIASLLGALVGSGAASIGFFYRKSAEEKKQYRGLIYHLLGVHAALRATHSLTPKKYLEACANVIERIENRPPNKEELYRVMGPHVARQIRHFVSHICDWDEAAYRETLGVVAEFNPTLAHQLRSNTMVTDVIPQTRDSWEHLLKSLEANNLPQEKTTEIIPIMEDEIYYRLQSSLKKDVQRIARTVGWVEYIKVNVLMRRYEKKTIEDNLEPFFRKVVENGEIGANKKLQGGPT